MKRFIIFIFLLIGNLTIAQNSEFKDSYSSDTSFAKYRSTYMTDTIYVNGNQLHWLSRNENGALPYEIEQYLWGRWTKIGEVMGKGTPGLNKYSININFHTGQNHFRLRQRGNEGGLGRFSSSAKYFIQLEESEYTIKENYIQFNKMTLYVIRKENKTIKCAFAKTIDISDIKKGRYLLSFDETTHKIKIKAQP